MRHSKRVTGISIMATSMLGIVISGCEPKLEFTHDGLPVFATGERRQLHRSEDLALPFRSAVVGDYLIVLDRASDPAVHVLNRFDGSLLQSYGRKGAGPGEFEGPWSIDPDPTADGFWVYDVQHSRMTHIDLGQLLVDPDSVVPEIVNIRASGGLSGPVWTSHGFWVSTGSFDDSRMAQLDRDGTELARVGPPPPGDPLISTSVRQQIHEGTIVSGPNGDRIVLASWYASRIDVFDPQGTLLAIMKVPFEWEIGVEDLATREFFAIRPDTRFGYMKATVSDKWIFGLFSGRTRRSNPERLDFGRFVHVFEWNGRFVGYIRLAVDAIDISVASDGATLYALEWHPLPTVSVYQLIPETSAQ